MFLRKSTRTAPKPAPSHRGNLRHSRRSPSLSAMWLEQRVLLSGGAPNPPGQIIAANPSVSFAGSALP